MKRDEGIGGVILFLLNLLLRKERELERKKAPVEATPRSLKPVILFLGMMALAALFFNSLGYPLIAFLLMVALLKILRMKRWPITNESIIDQTYFSKISPHPSFPKRGIPPFFKGRAVGI